MKFDKPIALAADHGGYELKEAIKAHLDELGVAYTDAPAAAAIPSAPSLPAATTTPTPSAWAGAS